MTSTAVLNAPLLFAHDDARSPRLLLATDGSPEATAARVAAVDLAQRLHAELHIVHAWLAPIGEEAVVEREAQRLLLREQLDAVNEHGRVHASHLVAEDPASAVLDTAASTGADLIVMGGRRLDGFDRMMGGSMSDRVTRHAPCSVLVVRTWPNAWPPARVAVRPHAREDEVLAGSAIASLFGMELHRPADGRAAPADTDDHDDRLLTVLVRHRHHPVADMVVFHRLHHAPGSVLVVNPPAAAGSRERSKIAGNGRFGPLL